MPAMTVFPTHRSSTSPPFVFIIYVTAFNTGFLTTIQGISTSEMLSGTRTTLLQDGLSLYIFQIHHLSAPKTQKNL